MDSELLSYAEALERVAAEIVRAMEDGSAARLAWSDWVELGEARGRILAQRILADRDLPPFARSTRDGFALRAGDLKNDGSETELVIAGTTRAGEAASELPANTAWEILTGAPMPRGADAVLMQEHAMVSDGVVRFQRVVKAGENLVAQGAEAKAGALLLEAGTQMGAAELGLAASCGYTKIRVRTRPRVLILTTGDELVEPHELPAAGQIRNSNGTILSALAEEAGAVGIQLPTARDERTALDAAIEGALKRAEEIEKSAPVMLVIAGGVSVGRFDLVEAALARRGAQFHFTGVRMQPGKPVVFGEIPLEDGWLKFFGLPGNPVSAAVTFRLFAEPLLRALAGVKERATRFMPAKLAGAWKGNPGLTRFLPAVCEVGMGEELELPSVRLCEWQGSGDLAAFARGNCLLMIPAEAGEIAAGEVVRILMR
jgi:molybdopterin molybdotransferase